MKWRRSILLGACAVALAGCSEDESTPLAPTPLPPEIVSVYPTARSTGIPYETQVWTRFRTPLQPGSVNATTVFLKVDTRRIPISFSLSDSNRLMTITPREELDLRRTHTVEITTQVRTTDGGALAETYFWQFRTTAVRRVEQPLPADGTITEGPYAPLFWRPTEETAGPIEYEVHFGTDSAAVAAGAGASASATAAHVLPPGRWDSGTRYYWRVHARTRETGDEDVGPVWSFATLPAGTATELFRVPVLDSGTWDDRANFKRWRCPELTSGSVYGPIVRFDLESLDSTWVIADAYLEIAPSGVITDHAPRLWELADGYVPCDGVRTGMPPLQGFLAPEALQPSGFIRFQSLGMIARIQGRLRRKPYFFNYSLLSARTVSYLPQTGNLWLFYYRLP
jgi:hypothetical protein